MHRRGFLGRNLWQVQQRLNSRLCVNHGVRAFPGVLKPVPAIKYHEFRLREVLVDKQLGDVPVRRLHVLHVAEVTLHLLPVPRLQYYGQGSHRGSQQSN